MAGVIHFLWLVKSDIHIPLEYASVVTFLLGWRVCAFIYNKRAETSPPARLA
jgi:DMSO/TMAO reductase YedYZ heme-binding membrane subunit